MVKIKPSEVSRALITRLINVKLKKVSQILFGLSYTNFAMTGIASSHLLFPLLSAESRSTVSIYPILSIILTVKEILDLSKLSELDNSAWFNDPWR